jgi:putative transposase
MIHRNALDTWCIASTSHSLATIISGFKAAASRRIRVFSEYHGSAVWQRSYYDRVIRNARELNAIRDYIANNPARWASG